MPRHLLGDALLGLAAGRLWADRLRLAYRQFTPNGYVATCIVTKGGTLQFNLKCVRLGWWLGRTSERPLG